MRITCVLLLIFCASLLFAEGIVEPFSFAISGEPDTLDPQATTGTLTFQVTRSIYDTLVEPDEEGEIVPALAESWTVSEDGTEWVFTLREDAYFHHGKQVSTGDVVATFERIQDPDFASPNSFEFDVIERVERVDRRSVSLRLSRPHAPLLATLASGWAAILPRDLIAARHDFGVDPVGSGPFRFVEWQRDRHIHLQSFESYWRGAPAIATLEFAIIKDPAVQAASLLSGAVQGVDILVEPELSRVRESSDAKVYESLSGLVLVISLNTRKYPLDTLEFRRALHAAIDRRLVLDIAYGGGVIVDTFMDAANPYYVDIEVRGYDPDWAQSIFEAFDLQEPLVIRVPQNFAPHVKAAEMYQEMLHKVGLDVDLELIDWQRWISEVYRENHFDMTVIGHTGKLDPDGRLTPYGTDETYVGWMHDEFVRLTGEARVRTDLAQRKELYAQALRIIGEELPFIYIGSSIRYVGLGASVEGFRMSNQLETFDFRDVTYR